MNDPLIHPGVQIPTPIANKASLFDKRWATPETAPPLQGAARDTEKFGHFIGIQVFLHHSNLRMGWHASELSHPADAAVVGKTSKFAVFRLSTRNRALIERDGNGAE